LEAIRGRDIAMIFQEPMTSLNPVFSVGDQVAEVSRLHDGLNRSGARQRASELFDTVGLVANRITKRYPHQLSGGQRQRVMIAMALACNPKLLIADEPTTALDVTVQAQILELIDQLRHEFGMAILLIAHDLGVVRHHCESVAIMYAGQIVECGTTEQVFSSPSHPELPIGCSFAPRCARATEQCTVQQPSLAVVSANGHQASCWNVPILGDSR